MKVKVKCIMCELIFAFIKKMETSGNEYFSDRARLTGRRDIFEGLKVDLIRILGCFCCSVIKKNIFLIQNLLLDKFIVRPES